MKFQVIGKQWFDRVNGNSYCAVRVYKDGETILTLPFTYGYGDYYLQYAKEELVKAGTIPQEMAMTHCNELFNQQELIEGCKKRDVMAWGK